MVITSHPKSHDHLRRDPEAPSAPPAGALAFISGSSCGLYAGPDLIARGESLPLMMLDVGAATMVLGHRRPYGARSFTTVLVLTADGRMGWINAARFSLRRVGPP